MSILAGVRAGIARAKQVAERLRRELAALALAARDPRTPFLAKAVTLIVVAYAASPIDLIPDFVPVIGYLDDLILVPLGIWLAIRLIPSHVLAEHRAAAAGQGVGASALGAALVVLLWLIGLGVLWRLLAG